MHIFPQLSRLLRLSSTAGKLAPCLALAPMASWLRLSSQYLPQYSVPEAARLVFAYTVVIHNESSDACQLRSRHWYITDGRGQIEEVQGDGVVGEQPQLGPGQAFQYTSGCVLETPRGTMHGSYTMHTRDGQVFDAEIAPFVLSMPGAGDGGLLN